VLLIFIKNTYDQASRTSDSDLCGKSVVVKFIKEERKEHKRIQESAKRNQKKVAKEVHQNQKNTM